MKVDTHQCPKDGELLTLIKGVVNRTVSPYNQDEWGYWWECLVCGYSQDVAEEEMSQIHDTD